MGVITIDDLPPGYPAELEGYYTLTNGHTVFVRPVVPSDADDIVEAARVADTQTLYHRFFTPAPRLDARRVDYLTHLDYVRRLALVARSEDGTGVAIVRYEGRDDAPEAEVAFTVRPGWRRLGLSSLLYGLLEKAAIDRGIEEFVALYLPDNHAAGALLEHLGFGPPSIHDGIAEVRKRLAVGSA